MKTTQLLIVLALSLLLAGSAGAQSQSAVPYGFTQHLNAAQMGMGGLTTTVATNAHTVIYNPGMLTRQPFAFEITIPIGIDMTVTDMAQFVNDNSDKFNDFQGLPEEEQSQFMQDSQEFDNKWFGVNLGPFVGLSFKNFGIAAYSIISPDVKLDQGVLVPSVGMRGYGDVVVAVGFGKTFEIAGRDIGIGLAGRFLNRMELQPQRISASDMGNTADIITQFMDDAADPISGMSVDLGAVHTIEIGEPGSDNNLDVAMVIQDLYGTIDGESLTPNLKAGAMYHMPFAGNPLLRRWDLGIEFVDLFNREGNSFYQRINMGTEISVLAGLLSVRGGFHQGYPTFGAGLRLAVVKIDVAKFTREMGTAPGQDPSDFYFMQFSFGW